MVIDYRKSKRDYRSSTPRYKKTSQLFWPLLCICILFGGLVIAIIKSIIAIITAGVILVGLIVLFSYIKSLEKK